MYLVDWALPPCCRTFASSMGKVAINLATGSLQKEEVIVGIDLGTTNSLVAVVREDSKAPVALKETDGLSLVPSIVHFNDAGDAFIGNAAKEHLVTDPSRTIYSVKRLMGKSYKEQELLKQIHTLREQYADKNGFPKFIE